jgi:hypothetical protein
MATLDFPDSPTIGDVFIAGSGSYEWTGTAWISYNLGNVEWTDVVNKPEEVETSATLETFVDGRINLVIDGAPGALDTLNELAAALGDDPNFATTVTTALGNKSDVGHTHVAADVTDLSGVLENKKTEVTYQIAANNTLVTGGRYFVDTNAPRTLTLPSAPAVGNEIWIADQTGLAGTNNITVNNGGSLINGVSDTLIIDVNGAIAVLLYTGSSLGWRI